MSAAGGVVGVCIQLNIPHFPLPYGDCDLMHWNINLNQKWTLNNVNISAAAYATADLHVGTITQNVYEASSFGTLFNITGAELIRVSAIFYTRICNREVFSVKKLTF